jgi:integrase
MARTVRDASLETRAARGRLKAQGKPYYRAIEPGLHVGYRRPTTGAGKWVVRHYTGGQAYSIEVIATADDFSDADGVAILSYKQAIEKARERMVDRAHVEVGEDRRKGPLTVGDVMEDYIAFLEANRRTAADARWCDRAFIRPKLGHVEVVDAPSFTNQLRRWLTDLVKHPPRLRTRAGEKQKYRQGRGDEDAKRAGRASANRKLTVLKAALNRAWRDGKTKSDAAWRRVEPFENVGAARVRYLTVVEATRLINASDQDFRLLVEGALQTGARYSELAQLTVADFNPDSGTVAIRQSKTGKPRHVVLTDEGAELFARVCAGRAGSDAVFQKASGGQWLKSHQKRPMAAACNRASIKPPASFHTLRHTWASLAVMNGVPLLVVAKNLGHSDTRMVEKHYGHLAPSYIVDAIRAGAPRFGSKPDRRITPLARG